MKTNYSFTLLICILISISTLAQDSRIWATYYGGTGNEAGFSVATDPVGNVFMAGITQSYNGIAAGGFQNNFGGGIVDAYLVKFDAAGNRLWATYYGGGGDEMAFFGGKTGIATDLFGNVYLAGFTNSPAGISFNGFQNTIAGTVNSYLVKFDAAGNRLWATYYGGTGPDKAYTVATDAAGNVYIAGIAGSTTGIASGGFQNTIGGLSDAFVAKFDSAGNRLWATYYGGTSVEEGYCLATDNSHNVYLAGMTTSTASIASGGFQNTYGGGGNDVFLVKFDSSGARLWATYYGGTGDEMALFAGDISTVTDASGNIYLAGLTTSTAAISFNGFQNTYGGGSSDAFLVKFDDTGNRIWATYYGGTGLDKAYSVTTDAGNPGNVFLTGRTDSPTAIASNGFQNNAGGSNDIFLVNFDASGNRLCATYFGQFDVDECNDVAADGSGNVYVAGGTANLSMIAFAGFHMNHGGGTSDAVLIKFTTSCITTSADENIAWQSAVSISPNPVASELRIKNEELKIEKVEIYDVLGQRVFSQKPEAKSQRQIINVSSLAAGIYFLKVHGGNQERLAKFVKQ